MFLSCLNERPCVFVAWFVGIIVCARYTATVPSPRAGLDRVRAQTPLYIPGRASTEMILPPHGSNQRSFERRPRTARPSPSSHSSATWTAINVDESRREDERSILNDARLAGAAAPSSSGSSPTPARSSAWTTIDVDDLSELKSELAARQARIRELESIVKGR